MTLKLRPIEVATVVTQIATWEPRLYSTVNANCRDMSPEDLAQLVVALEGPTREAFMAECRRMAPILPKDKRWAFDMELGQMLTDAETRALRAETQLRQVREAFRIAMDGASGYCRSDGSGDTGAREFLNGAGSVRACFHRVERAFDVIAMEAGDTEKP